MVSKSVNFSIRVKIIFVQPFGIEVAHYSGLVAVIFLLLAGLALAARVLAARVLAARVLAARVLTARALVRTNLADAVFVVGWVACRVPTDCVGLTRLRRLAQTRRSTLEISQVTRINLLILLKSFHLDESGLVKFPVCSFVRGL